jgi:hypothetical protein
LVGGDPVRYRDPSGLTQCDIDVALSLIREEYPYLDFGEAIYIDYPEIPMDPDKADYGNSDPNGDRTIQLNTRLPHHWGDKDVLDQVLDTLIHEALHFDSAEKVASTRGQL